MKPPGRIAALGAVAGVVLLAIACGNDSSTSTTPTETPAPPTVTEPYVGTIGIGGSGFYSFSVSRTGTVNLTLNAVSGVDGPGVMLSLALGVPSGFGCTASGPTITTAAGPGPHLTASSPAGVYCASVSDVGNLTGPATFDLSIAHP